MSRIRVLQIEDSEADAALLVRELERGGYNVIHRRVDNAEEMHQALTEEEWDVILCDYVVPGFSGRDALTRLQGYGLDIPVIVISGQIGEDIAVDAMRAGAKDYIMKDNLRRLVPAIQRELQELADRRQRMMVEEELEEKKRELEVVRQMDELKDEFISLVSHEMRNPLTVMMGNLFLLKNSQSLDAADIAEMAEGAYQEAQELAVILDNLLEMARAKADRLHLDYDTLNLPEIINEVIANVPRGNQHRLAIDIASDVPAVRGDSVRIRRVLYNLIDNAIKYSPHGGDVIISAERNGQEVVIGIHDGGLGIEPDKMSELFKPFSRLEKGRSYTSGIGLGLMVCQRLCEAHGGRIWAESKEGEGSSFYFTIPVSGE